MREMDTTGNFSDFGLGLGLEIENKRESLYKYIVSAAPRDPGRIVLFWDFKSQLETQPALLLQPLFLSPTIFLSTDALAMAPPTSMPSALTFELVARCSVSLSAIPENAYSYSSSRPPRPELPT